MGGDGGAGEGFVRVAHIAGGAAFASASAIGGESSFVSGAATSTATATGGTGKSQFGYGSDGGAATANATSTTVYLGPAIATATATGGNGGSVRPLFDFAGPGKGGDANATASATGNSLPTTATATAIGGMGGAGAVGGASGQASAQSTAQLGYGSVMTTAHSPAAQGQASASTTASVGAGPAAMLINITPGETVSDATLLPASKILGAGAMSAAYGGAGESLTYSAEADFNFTTGAPEEFYLTLLDNNASGNGFDKLKFQVTVDGTIEVLDTFTSLSVAESFFSGNPLDLGAWSAANQTVDISYWLTASEPGAGFGFTYNVAVPEASTWAMMWLGFAGLGFAGYRRATAEV